MLIFHDDKPLTVFYDTVVLAKKLYKDAGEEYESFDEERKQLAVNATSVHIGRALPAPADELEKQLGVEAYDAAVNEADRLNDLAGRDIGDACEEVEAIKNSLIFAERVEEFIADNIDVIGDFTQESYCGIGERFPTGDYEADKVRLLAVLLLKAIEDSGTDFQLGLKTLIGPELFKEVQTEADRVDKMETLGGAL